MKKKNHLKRMVFSEKSENKMYSSFENNEISDKSEIKMYSLLDENVNDSILRSFP